MTVFRLGNISEDDAMSALLEVLEKRYSCRAFSEQKVDEELIDEVIRAGQLAPSACNLQPYVFYVVTGGSMNVLSKIRPWYGAPSVILGCYCADRGWVRGSDHAEFRQFDLGLAMGQMALRACDLGLGSCFIASFTAHEIQSALKLPVEHCPEIGLALGYAETAGNSGGPSAQHFKRKERHQILFFRV